MDFDLPTRRRVLRATGGTALFGLAGCLGDDGGTDTGTSDGGLSGPQPSATVDMIQSEDGSENYNDPLVVWVENGGTVTFVMDSGNHSATAYSEENDQPRRIPEGANSFDSGVLLDEGETFEHTFETEGVYDYFCIPHHGMGMVGSVIVGQPSPDGQPGLAEPQSSLPGDAGSAISEVNQLVRDALGDG
ncbi:plastocyanin/azurin family copper-binding protein [Haloarchaeobius sp. DFWS5]|uniref:plastocyanin/azurin family copper-binding protein n=1 Tax=Haloarchaeobius sp. DFWS5 TaxID=3446114 RepID=UPI003EB8DB1D